MAAHVQGITKSLHIKQPAWKALEAHYKRARDLHLRELFTNDPTRGERMSAHGAGIYLDYSKNRITDHTLGLLLQLAEQSGDRKSTRLNSSHTVISYAVFCLKKKKT